MSKQDPAERIYYEEIEEERYHYQYHIPLILDWLQWRNKYVLEIGTGVGTDARQIIARGGNYIGINVDKGSVEATKRSLDVFDLTGMVSNQVRRVYSLRMGQLILFIRLGYFTTYQMLVRRSQKLTVFLSRAANF